MPAVDYVNRFEVPLPLVDTEEIFDVIHPNNPYSIYIKNVYAPPYHSDGTSARYFGYNYDETGYKTLLKKINGCKPVVLTYPSGAIGVMKRYLDIGIMYFMISSWQPEYEELKKQYTGMKIYRSIVFNHDNCELEDGFDGYVVPYRKLLDLRWLEQASRKGELIAIPNHFCRVECKNMMLHAEANVKNTKLDILPRFKCTPEGTNFFLPKGNLDKMAQYISTFKLVERGLSCHFFMQYIKYYADGILMKPKPGNDPAEERLFALNMLKIERYENSNLPSGMCGFNCSVCQKRCF